MEIALIVLLISFVIFAIMGLPLSFSMALSSVCYFIYSGRSLNSALHSFFDGLNVFVMMAIPLFIFAGLIMTKCGIADNIIEFSNLTVGRFKGGLAQINVLASMLFGGCTGSALSDVSGLGTLLIPAMKKSGYDESFAAAVTVSSSLQGPIIPPSIPMVIYGSIVGTSTGALLVAGAIPGVLIGVINMIMVYIISRKRNYAAIKKNYTFKEVINISRKSIIALLMPLIIIGGILSGIFTPTEAAAVATGYGLFVGIFLFRTLGFKEIYQVCGEVAMRSAVILFLVGSAGMFGWILSIERVPLMVHNLISNITTNPILILIIINVILLLWGMVMDIMPALLLLAPVFAPIVINLGVHPVHFGVIMVFNLMIGLMTPPYGACIFAAVAITDVDVSDISIELLPFLAFNIILLFVITFIPEISLFLPRVAGLI